MRGEVWLQAQLPPPVAEWREIQIKSRPRVITVR
jgi:hypothetical protein